MELYKAIKKEFRKQLKKLNSCERAFLTNEKPFFSEYCSLCSHSFHGVYDSANEIWVKTDRANNGHLCCEKTGNASELCSWKSEGLTPEQALDYYHNGGKFCADYTGTVPSEETIKEWIKNRDKVIQKVTGCENLEQLYAFLK